MSFYDTIPLLQHEEAIKATAEQRDNHMMPIHVRMEPTESCNFTCQFCVWHDPDRRQTIQEHLDTTGKRHLPKERMLALIDELADLGTQAISFTGAGDPLVYPYMEEVLRKIRSRGLAAGVTSNIAMPLKDGLIEELSHCRWVRWSMNAGSEEVYVDVNRPRGKDPSNVFHRARKNAGRLVKMIAESGSSTSFNASYVVHVANQHDVYAAAEQARNIGLEGIAFRPDTPFDREDVALDYDPQVAIEMQRAVEELSSDRFQVYVNEDRLEDIRKLGNSEVVCHYANHTTYIAANGDIYPCCYTRYDRRYVIGNILDQPFSEFWNSERRQNFYRGLVNDTCPSCPHGQVNLILHRLKSGKSSVEEIAVVREEPNPFI